MLANSRPIRAMECATCDFWLGNRDIKVGKAEVLCAPKGQCPMKRMAVEMNFKCGSWKMWKRLL